jgi:predicted nucleic acid-binding protein
MPGGQGVTAASCAPRPPPAALADPFRDAVVLLADTNIWLAAADRRSDRHQDCAAILREHGAGLAAPVPVIAETSWLILDRLGTAAQASFLRLITSGRLTPVDLTAEDWQRCAELRRRGRAPGGPRRLTAGPGTDHPNTLAAREAIRRLSR